MQRGTHRAAVEFRAGEAGHFLQLLRINLSRERMSYVALTLVWVRFCFWWLTPEYREREA